MDSGNIVSSLGKFGCEGKQRWQLEKDVGGLGFL